MQTIYCTAHQIFIWYSYALVGIFRRRTGPKLCPVEVTISKLKTRQFSQKGWRRFNRFPIIISCLWVTYKTEFWADDWIYCTLYIDATLNYRQYSVIADLHALYRITWFLDSFHRLVFQRTRRFGNWICFRPQVNVGEKTPTKLGPLETTGKRLSDLRSWDQSNSAGGNKKLHNKNCDDVKSPKTQ
jgi:hypothetical protein